MADDHEGLKRGAVELRTRRKAAGLTQTQLADEIHANQSTVSRWEKGIELPTSSFIEALWVRLGIERLWWYTDTERKRVTRARGARRAAKKKKGRRLSRPKKVSGGPGLSPE